MLDAVAAALVHDMAGDRMVAGRGGRLPAADPHPIEIDLSHGDKLGHAFAYRVVPSPLGVGFVALGVALEYLQGWSGYRDFEYGGRVAAAAGVLLGWRLAGTALARRLPSLE